MREAISASASRRACSRRSRPWIASAARRSASSERRRCWSSWSRSSAAASSKMAWSSWYSPTTRSTACSARSRVSRSCGVSPVLPSQASVSASSSCRAGWLRRLNNESSVNATLRYGTTRRPYMARARVSRSLASNSDWNRMPIRSIASSSSTLKRASAGSSPICRTPPRISSRITPASDRSPASARA